MSTNIPGDGQPEYLGPGSPAPADRAGHDDPGLPDSQEAPPRHGRRTGIVVGAAVAVVAAVGVGSYGLVQLMAGGSSPATVVPADALGYVSLDLDPSASQKIEAFKTMRKFPSLKKDLHIGGQDDLRRAIFDGIVEDGDCKGLSYSQDVEPWIGNRVAVAAIPDAKKIVLPLVAVQVTDEAKAKKGIQALQHCGDSGRKSGDAVGISFSGDYALITEKQADADAMAKDAEAASLADDADFKTWTGRTGDPGIVTMYASKDVPGAIVRGMRQSISSDVAGFDNDEEFVRQEKQYLERSADRVNKAFAGFEGAAGTVRFHDGAVEADFVTKGLQDGLASGDGAGREAAGLPSTTAMTVSVAVRQGWLQSFLDMAGGSLIGPMDDDDAMWKSAEQATGLNLPEDIETMFGHGFAVSVDSSADLEKLFSSNAPIPTPVGIRIQGDPDKIVPIIDKLKKTGGPDADVVKVAHGDDAVAVSLDARYADKLLGDGGLGDEHAFKDVVPEPDRASAVVYVNFDSGSWLEQLVDGDAETKANLAPLHAFGASVWTDGDQVRHASLRLTTD